MTGNTDNPLTLDTWLPDHQVLTDLRKVVESDDSEAIELDVDSITIPDGCQYDIVSKAFIEERLDIGFGTCFRVDVAVGGVESTAFGIVRARYCFATLWYRPNATVITIDFNREMSR